MIKAILITLRWPIFICVIYCISHIIYKKSNKGGDKDGKNPFQFLH